MNLKAVSESVQNADTGDDSRVLAATRACRQDLIQERNRAGHWVGELSTSALSTATAVSALCTIRRHGGELGSEWGSPQELDNLIDGGCRWLQAHQNSDGGWGDTDLSHSNISTTMLVLAAWRLADRQKDWAEQVQAGRKYVEQLGGIAGLRRRYGRDKTFAVPILANAAIAGEVDWKEVAPLPFEAACVPQSWYRFMQLPVVSYAIPALVAIGQAKFVNSPPWNPLARMTRHFARSRSLKVLEKMQPASGGFLEAIPLTSFVVMGLGSSGNATHNVVRSGLRFIRESVRDDGSWPIDTNLATWNTSLSINALTNDQGTLGLRSETPADRGDEHQGGGSDDGVQVSKLGGGGSADAKPPAEVLHDELLSWLLSCQYREIHPFTGSKPGGWGWSDLSGAVPDADDTPGAMLALARWSESAEMGQSKLSSGRQEQIHEAVELGAEWLLRLQNRDGGWPTFCRGWGKLPFDRSGSDLTAHAMRALGAWSHRLPEKKVQGSLEQGWDYLAKQQRSDGSWLPLWFGNQDHPEEENPIYGTVKVLLAFRDLDRWTDASAIRGIEWLAAQQHPDGSFGGGPSVEKRTSWSIGSVEETALAVEILADARNNGVSEAQIQAGVDWLCEAVESGRHLAPSPIGFYFAKLWYHERLYPLIFTAAALSRVCRCGDKGSTAIQAVTAR